MKAAVCTEFGTPEVIRLGDVAKPVPRTREVLIRVHAAAVTAIDTTYRRSTGKFVSSGRTRKQKILGYYMAGEVAQIGEKVKRFTSGDRVFGGNVWSAGAYAEYKCLPEDEVQAMPPFGMTHEQAAVLPYGGGTALPFIRGNVVISLGHQ